MDEKHGPSQDVTILAKGAGLSFVGSVVGYLLLYLMVIVTTRSIGAERYGIYVLGITVIQLVTSVAYLGMDRAIVRFLSIAIGQGGKGTVKGTLIKTLAITAVVGATLMTLTWLLAEPVALHFFHEPELGSVMRILAVSIPFMAVGVVAVAATQARKTMRYKVYVNDLLRPGSQFFITSFLLLLGLGIWAAVGGLVTASVLVFTLALYYVGRLYWHKDYSGARSTSSRVLLAYALPVSLLTVVTQFRGQMESLFLGYFRDSAEVSIYFVAYRLTIVGIMIITSFNSIVSPFVADLANRNQRQELSRLYKTVTRWVLTISMPLFTMLILLARPVMGLFGQDFTVGTVCLVILSVAQLLNTAVGPSGIMLVMSKYPVVELGISLFALAFNLILVLLLVPGYGVLGAALSNGIIVVVVNAVRLIQVSILLRIQPYSFAVLKPIAAGLLAGIPVLLLDVWLGTASDLTDLVAYGMVYVVTYALIVFILGLNQDDRVVLVALRRRLRSSRPRPQ